jgi:hypothetical protein
LPLRNEKHHGEPHENCSLLLNLNLGPLEYESKRLPLVLYVRDRENRQMGKTLSIKFTLLREAISSSHERYERLYCLMPDDVVAISVKSVFRVTVRFII